MARRPSIVTKALELKLHGARDKLVALYMSDTTFDLKRVSDIYLRPMQEAVATMKGRMLPEVRERMYLSCDNSMVLVMPLRTRAVKQLRGGKRQITGSESFKKWKDYRDTTRWNYDHAKENQQPTLVAGVSLTITYETHCVPTQYPHPRSYMEPCDTADEGWLLSPKTLGDEYFEELEEQLGKIYDLIVMCEHKVEFGKQAAKAISTEGICKKVWPESVNFLPVGTAALVRGAKASSWPLFFRRCMADLKPGGAGMVQNNNGVDTKYLHAQLKSVGDMILQAELAPTLESLTEGCPGIGKLEVEAVCVDTGYLKRYTDLAPIR